ncbi:uncharacterized protein FA14DRAFT_162042 [Meira miltonrushii]|uniref:Zn(2)-C6 fungal-type domain-containing protein n=1 Tax=Meira miltonrushii TaxID=1280837 RepID=A0A316V5K0_9BASI|nr:uncharacterized protein FA14DRAFT_162042 [Meira miltonrushii]PWN32742.1 hypothetical protein FA14DRAFT_162042 [Meira miltonrushii]
MNYNNQSAGDNGGMRQYHDQIGSHPQQYPFANGNESFNSSSFHGISRPSSASHNTKPGHIRTPPSGQYFTSSPNSSGTLGGYGPAYGQSTSKGNSPGYSATHRGSVGGETDTLFAYGPSASGIASPRSGMPFQSNQQMAYSNSQGHHIQPYPPANLRHTPHPLAQSDIPQNTKQSDSPSSDTPTQSQQRNVGVTPLRRGQACQSCRRRKLKCDAQRPVCGTCIKSRKAAAVANHASPVPDGDCVYDDPVPVPPAPVPSSSSSGKQQESAYSPSTLSASPGQGGGGGGNTTSSDSNFGTQNRPSIKRQRTSGSATGMPVRDSRPFSRGATEGRESKENKNETTEQKATRLEARVADLEDKLRQARAYGVSGSASHYWDANSTPYRWRSRASSREPEPEEALKPAVPILSMLSPLSGREEKHRMRYFQRPAGVNIGSLSTTSSMRTGMDAEYPNKAYPSMPRRSDANEGNSDRKDSATEVDTDPMLVDSTKLESGTGAGDESFMQLLWPGWSNDLPSSEIVTTLCEIFFRLHPLRTLVYRPTFMSGLLLPIHHPHRPHDSLIHAILCAAADISPYHDNTTMVNGMRDRFVTMLADPTHRPNVQQSNAPNTLTFKEFHLSKGRQKIERSLMTDFRNPLDWLAGGTIIVYVLWNEGRFVESYFLSGFLARAIAPAGLDKLPSRHFSPAGKVRATPGLFGDAHGLEEHERRMVLWHTFLADQYTSGPPGFYENMIHEQAVLTHLPCSVNDFLAGNDVAPNSQTLSSADLFTTGHLDEFTLHIKSAILLRRVCTLSSRSQGLRSKPPGVPIMDKQIDEFISTFPPKAWFECSSDGLNAYSNISLAMIYLHEPYLSRSSLCTVKEAEPAPTSANGRILLAVEKVMQMLHQLVNSSLDFALLHPQMFLTWSVCARMMGKDMILLQKRMQPQEVQTDSPAKGNAEGTKAKTNGSKKTNSTKPLVPDEGAALHRVMENLALIVGALRRAGVKSVKARRCSELVSSVRSGHLHEMFLSHLLYLDGVIPVEQEDSFNGEGLNNSSMLALTQNPAFDAMLQSNAMPSGGMSVPMMMSMLSDPAQGASTMFSQNQQNQMPEPDKFDFNAFTSNGFNSDGGTDSTQVVADLLSEPFLVDENRLETENNPAISTQNEPGLEVFNL